MFHTKALWHTYNKNVVHAVVHPSDAPSVCTAVASCWASLSSTNSDDCGHRILDRVSWPRARHCAKSLNARALPESERACAASPPLPFPSSRLAGVAESARMVSRSRSLRGVRQSRHVARDGCRDVCCIPLQPLHKKPHRAWRHSRRARSGRTLQPSCSSTRSKGNRSTRA